MIGNYQNQAMLHAEANVEACVVHLCRQHCIGGASVQADEAASWYVVGTDHAVHHGKRRAATRALGTKRNACWPVLGARRYSSRARDLLLLQQRCKFNLLDKMRGSTKKRLRVFSPGSLQLF